MRLASRSDAELFQQAVEALCGYMPCGYKIGATNSGSQRLVGTSEPMFGPVFAERLLESGATFAPPAGVLGIECEFAFRLGRKFPILAALPP